MFRFNCGVITIAIEDLREQDGIKLGGDTKGVFLCCQSGGGGSDEAAKFGRIIKRASCPMPGRGSLPPQLRPAIKFGVGALPKALANGTRSS